MLLTWSVASALSTTVVGGGFAGLYTALKLDGPVTLIDSRDRFAFLPLLYEYACGEAPLDEVSAPFSSLFPGFVKGTVEKLDLARKTVQVDGREIKGDAMVIALGKEPAQVPEFALPFYRLEDATRIREQSHSWDKVLVVGGGYTGVELACHLSRSKQVTLAHRGAELLPKAQAHNRATARKALRNVDVRLSCSVLTDPGGFDAVIWTAGTRQAAPVRNLFDDAIRVDAALRVRRHKGVFALGDCAAVAGCANMAPSAQSALQQATVAARNVQAYLAGSRALRTFNYVELGEMLSYGDKDGSASFLKSIDLEGPAASLARRLIYAARMPTPQQRLTALSLLTKPS